MRAKLIEEWVYGACEIQRGSYLEGAVVDLASGTDSKAATKVSLGFIGHCDNGTKGR